MRTPKKELVRCSGSVPWSCWESEPCESEVKCAYKLNSEAHKLGSCQRNCRNQPNCLSGLTHHPWFDPNFDYEDGGVSGASGCSLRTHGSFVGLENLGNTCYINSLLQLWFHNIPLREAVYTWRRTKQKHAGPFADHHMQVCSVEYLQKLFAEMQFGVEQVCQPQEFCNSLNIDVELQQDAQEFNKLYMQQLEDAFVGCCNKPARNIVQNQLRGMYSYVTKCCACRTESRRHSFFYELELNVKGCKTIENSLELFLKEEVVGDEVVCSKCSRKCSATTCIQLQRLPNVLQLQLLRYKFDTSANIARKVQSTIHFPEVLDMTPFISLAQPQQTALYSLQAVLLHDGSSTYSGHYYAHINTAKGWFLFDDVRVEKEKLIQADGKQKLTKLGKHLSAGPMQGYRSSTAAYMLVYERQAATRNGLHGPVAEHNYCLNLAEEDSRPEEEGSARCRSRLIHSGSGDDEFNSCLGDDEFNSCLGDDEFNSCLRDDEFNSYLVQLKSKKEKKCNVDTAEQPACQVEKKRRGRPRKRRLASDSQVASAEVGMVVPSRTESSSNETKPLISSESSCMLKSEEDTEAKGMEVDDGMAGIVWSKQDVWHWQMLPKQLRTPLLWTKRNVRRRTPQATKQQDRIKTLEIWRACELGEEPSLAQVELIDAEWLQSWLRRPQCQQQPVDNSRLVCPHGKASPADPKLYKMISHKGADQLYAEWGGGPRLYGPDMLCSTCVQSKLRSKQLETDVGTVRKLLKQSKNKSEAKYWVCKKSLAAWTSIGKHSSGRNEVVLKAQDSFDSMIVCCHGNLSSVAGDLCLVGLSAWAIIKKHFPNCREFKQDTEQCRLCQYYIT